ncbi:hypothetical protein BZA70DRAFT_135022 [Myxozyma melibiosi]|uniref:Uncharacterized protein n=1 Tax=Myxozyma melibiosi TaxID=54550 RepID=A0ABR1F9C1_9ASCO
MSYYDSSAWQAAAAPPPAPVWEARSVSANSLPVEETGAFSSQIDEVERALDNLIKSGKFFPARRDGMPLLSPGIPHGPVAPIDPRMAQPVARPPFVSMASDPEIMRSQSSMAALNGFYASQRFQPSPVSQTPNPRGAAAADPEQVLQMKRRLAAARERELRNYHQEQQFNRSMSPDTARKVFPPQQPPTPTGMIHDLPAFNLAGMGKERVMSPSALSEDDRREMLNRQHRALYGEMVSAEEQQFLRASGTPSEPRVMSPRLAFDPFQQQLLKQQQQQLQQQQQQLQIQQQQQHQQQQQQQQQQQLQQQSQQQLQLQQQNRESNSPIGRPRSNSNGTSSPSSRSANFSLFDSTTTRQSNTSASSPEHSPPRAPLVRANTSATVGPIGSRPIGIGSGAIGGSRPIGSPFSLGHESDPFSHHLPERSPSVASNPSSVVGGGDTSSLSSSFNGGSLSSSTNNINNNQNNTPGAKNSAPGSASNPSTSSSTGNMAWSSKVWGNKGLGMAASVWG